MTLIPYPIPHPLPQIERRIEKAEFMASNHKLSALLKGRVAQEMQYQADRVLLIFKDGSKLQVKTLTTVAPDSILVPAGVVRAVRQNDETLMLDFEAATVAPPAETKPDPSKPKEEPPKIEAPKEEIPNDEKPPAMPTTITIHTAEATACVMLRDAKGVLEYAD